MPSPVAATLNTASFPSSVNTSCGCSVMAGAPVTVSVAALLVTSVPRRFFTTQR